MNYNLKGTNVSITDEIRGHIEKKLSALDKLVKDAGDPRVDVEVEYKEGEAKTYRAELMLYAQGVTEPLRAEAEGATLHDAVDVAASELLQELTKAKKKRIHMLRHTGARVKDFLRGWRSRP
jgi:putative sigma-54 modulation protein